MNPNAEGQVIAVLVIAVILAIVFCRRRWRGSGTAFGTSAWMSDSDLRKAGMLAGNGLVLGRTFGGALLRPGPLAPGRPAVLSPWRGANCASQGRPRSSGVMP